MLNTITHKDAYSFMSSYEDIDNNKHYDIDDYSALHTCKLKESCKVPESYELTH